jgi:hypothetical protein
MYRPIFGFHYGRDFFSPITGDNTGSFGSMGDYFNVAKNGDNMILLTGDNKDSLGSLAYCFNATGDCLGLA